MQFLSQPTVTSYDWQYAFPFFNIRFAKFTVFLSVSLRVKRCNHRCNKTTTTGIQARISK